MSKPNSTTTTGNGQKLLDFVKGAIPLSAWTYKTPEEISAESKAFDMAHGIGCLGSGRSVNRLQAGLYGCPLCNATFGQAEVGDVTWPTAPVHQAR